MPKKRHPALYTKPSSTAHRSFPAAAPPSRDALPSVNDLLNNLRLSQPHSHTPPSLPTMTPTMPPPIRQLLSIPETPSPRPRRRRLLDPNGRRLPAGPAPPQSWLSSSIYSKHPSASASKIGAALLKRSRSALEHLPGITRFPARSSLISACLVGMAKTWSFQIEYHHSSLAALPTELRVLLLSYIAHYGSEEGINHEGLKTILSPPTDANFEFGGNDDFTRLDLSGALGAGISFRHLQTLLSHTSPPLAATPTSSWDAIPPHISEQRLPHLKQLSLANPHHGGASWRSLLALAAHLPTLTHLSLAHWPMPSLTPNATTASMQGRFGRVQYGGTGVYSHVLDGDWSEARGVLRRLAARLYGLEELDVDGCHEWWAALMPSGDGAQERGDEGVDWTGCWRGVKIVKMREGEGSWVPLALERRVRKAPARGWIDVLRDGWEAAGPTKWELMARITDNGLLSPAELGEAHPQGNNHMWEWT